MKKLLSVLLVVCMITGCLFFASCSSKKVSVKDFEKDPQAALTEASKNSTNAFFADDAKTQSIIEKATEKGSVTVSFECDDLAEIFSNVTETIYMDSKNGKLVSDTTVKMGGEELFARVFVNKDGLAASGESIFGDETTLLVNIATLADKFGESAMVEMFGIPAEALPEVEEMMATLTESYSKLYDTVKDSEATNELANKVYAAMNTTYATEDGCIVVTYTLNNATVKAMCKLILDEAKAMLPEVEDMDATMTEIETQLNEAMAELDNTMTLSFTEKLYINQKANKIEKMTIEGSATPKAEGAEAVTAKVTALYTDDKNTVDVEMTAAGETVKAKAELARTEADGKVTYKLSTDVTAEGETRNLINVSYTYNKDNGEFTLAADVFTEDGADRMAAELTGKITTTKDSATYEFNSVKVGTETVTFKLSLTFKALDSIPEIPADAKDVTTLTKGDWVDLVESIQNSDLGKLITGSPMQ